MGVRVSLRAQIKDMARKIILASTSPKRKELLAKAGLKFEVVSSDYIEDMTLPLAPRELATFLSRGKAETVVKKYKNAVIISADTFIYFKGKVIGKPHTKEKALETLKKLSGHTHSVFTGFTVIDTKNSKIISQAVETKITFKKLSIKIIKDYIKEGNPLKYAGSYTLNDITEKSFVEKVEGDSLNVIGLPVSVLMKVLKKFGIEVKN